ncbi:MAG: hypothetical protein B1H03_07155 [Planctomycetales bacterium 4484_113]|nr:MAG: hypothetical protein B1H03_07155 [Planctomycetales bacterium 4484_113]
MKRIILAMLLITIFALPAHADRFDELMGPYASAFSQGLTEIGLTWQDVTIDLGDRNFYGGDRYRLRFFDTFIANPWKIPEFVPLLRDSALELADDPPMLMVVAQNRLGNSVRLGLISDPVEPFQTQVDAAPAATCILDAVKGFCEKEGYPLTNGEITYLRERGAAVPPPVAKEVALFFAALPDVLTYRKYAMKPVIDHLLTSEYTNPVETYVKSISEENEDEALAKSLDLSVMTEYLLDNLDYNYLHTGGTLLGFVAKAMREHLRAFTDDADFSFTFETPLGLIALNGKANDIYTGGVPYLLIIDTGGDDSYAGGASTISLSNPVSVLFDLSGDDTYKNESTAIPAFGSGVFGYGYLFDEAGDDSYDSPTITQGAGIFGVGLLMDSAGDDSYATITGGQASGTYGTGILSDLSGNDTYECYQLSQGYGFTRGVGLLVDKEGNDRYTANDTDIRFPSAQSKEHNSSLSQGFGFGRRSDIFTGHSWAGGVGMLFDGAGDDRYSCGIFGQGAGYWYGTGILADASGNDDYEGHWYVQASAAHFALGILDDAAGDDHYFADMNMAQGAGHDFSLGFLVERAGDDTYDSTSLALGGGNANGIGIFWDILGDDTYKTVKGTNFGKGNPARGGIRNLILCLGIFADTAGVDTYPSAKPFAGNDKVWTQQEQDGKPPKGYERGVGIDTEITSPPPQEASGK